jgi:nicotinamidase-related amidase
MRMPGYRGSLRLRRAIGVVVALTGALWPLAAAGSDETLALRLRSRAEAAPGQYEVVEKKADWDPARTAVIVCDMWDLHHCLNAVRRCEQMAPRMDRVLTALRERGAVVIHAPSGCMAAYDDHPARRHALATPRAQDQPRDIGQWCRQIASEAKGTYPIDQADGGEDDDPAEHAAWVAKLAALGRNPKAPWQRQTDRLAIADSDYISDSGEEIWSILEHRRIGHVVLLGVHLNMCVLGRPFGLRQMARNGRDVVLMRDLTDTMYNPERAPRVSHYAGTDLMVEHVEKYVCPTITSDQVVGGAPLRFRGDRRPHLVMVIAEDEYKTELTLPVFASRHLAGDYHVSYAVGQGSEIAGLGALRDADVAVISVRRRVIPRDQLDTVRAFVAAGKGLVGLRTASHAFAPRSPVAVAAAPALASHPLLGGVDVRSLVGHGSLYRVSPLAKSATPLLIGTIPGQPPEPVAWINVPDAKGRVFYCSLGHKDDFTLPDFNRLLRNAIDWAAR